MLLISLFACTKNEQISNAELKPTNNEIFFRSVSEKEYQEASPFTKRLINKIDASINSLNIIEKNSSVQYEAIFIISIDENKIFNNSLVISPIEKVQNGLGVKINSFAESTPDGKCTICGISSAYDCISEVKEYMNKKHKDEIDVHVKRNGKCVDITYK